MSAPPVIIIGAGGHAKVVLDCLRASGRQVLGLVDPSPSGPTVLGIPVLGDESVLESHTPDRVQLCIGVGSVRVGPRRAALFKRFADLGYRFAVAIHPSAVVGAEVTIGEGAQIMAGTVIQPGCVIGRNAIVNTGACVDHDCVLGDHCHLAPGAVLSGGVSVGEGAHVGAGAILIQSLTIGRRALIAAGAVVIGDVGDDAVVGGVPARALT